MIDISAICGKCGAALDIEENNVSKNWVVDVEPCSHCMDEAREEGEKSGYDTGFDDGRDS